MKLKYLLALALCLVWSPAKAELQIDVNGAMRDPLPVAFPEMIHEGFFLGQTGAPVCSELFPKAATFKPSPQSTNNPTSLIGRQLTPTPWFKAP